jgi:hypothetical protein
MRDFLFGILDAKWFLIVFSWLGRNTQLHLKL